MCISPSLKRGARPMPVDLDLRASGDLARPEQTGDERPERVFPAPVKARES
ncbi:MAG TPA: hypothetical protein PK201_12410 [Accumulibacter sp.]|nr:hypothetical protein [Accumulibacter sp.]